MAHKKLTGQKSALDMVKPEKRTEVLAVSLLAELEPEEKIARLFKAKALTIELHLPDDGTLAVLRAEPTAKAEADSFVVESDDEYELAKVRAFSLKDEYEGLEEIRTESTTALLGMKYAWDGMFQAQVQDKKLAAVTYFQKMRVYEDDKRREAEDAKRVAEERLKAEQEQALREAEELEELAAKKRGREKQALMQEAEGIRRSAQLMPTEVATSQIAEPPLGSGSKARPWLGEVVDPVELVRWLAEKGHEEWVATLVDWRQAGLNSLAKSVTNSRKIPGFKAQQSSGYRRPPKTKALNRA